MFKKLIVILFAVLSATPLFASEESVPFNCLQEARNSGKITCNLSKHISRIKLGFASIKMYDNKTQEIFFSKDNFQFGEINTKQIDAKSLDLLTFILLFPFFGMIIVHLLNGSKKISRRKLIIFDVVIIASVIITGLFGVFAGGIVGGLFGVFAGGLVGGYTGGYAGLFAGTLANALVGVLAGIFTTRLVEYGFWESIQRAMIPEYILFILATMFIGFIMREIAFRFSSNN